MVSEVSFDSLIEPLENVTLILRTMNDRGNLKCSPHLFALSITQISPLCMAAFRCMPPFFPRYSCDTPHTISLSIDQLYRTYRSLKRAGNNVTSLDLERALNRLSLTFLGPRKDHTWTGIPIMKPYAEDFLGEVNYRSFVTIELHEFKSLVNRLTDNKAIVTITDSQIKFSTHNDVITLTKQRGQCIIGGFGPREEHEFTITFYPVESFNNYRSPRIWFFKPCDANGIILIAPIGLHAHISAYFPRRLWQFV